MNFSAEVSGGLGPYTYLWAFGDGTSSTEASPQHSFVTAPTQTSTVTVTDHLGYSLQVNTTVPTVQPCSSTTSTGGGSGGLSELDYALIGGLIAAVGVGVAVAVLLRRLPPPDSD